VDPFIITCLRPHPPVHVSPSDVPSHISLADFGTLQDLLLVTSGDLSLDLERARLLYPGNSAECAKSLVVGAVERFAKHRCSLISAAANKVLAYAAASADVSSVSDVYYTTTADFVLQQRLSEAIGATGSAADTRLITYCDTLQRAYDRRSAVQDGMQGFPSMALSTSCVVAVW
jgi:hypothetical protein